MFAWLSRNTNPMSSHPPRCACTTQRDRKRHWTGLPAVAAVGIGCWLWTPAPVPQDTPPVHVRTSTPAPARPLAHPEQKPGPAPVHVASSAGSLPPGVRKPSVDDLRCTAFESVPRGAAGVLVSNSVATQAAGLLAQGRRPDLATLAMQAGDAVTFAMAWQACAGGPPLPACAQLEPGHWSQLDPDNAMAWLVLADRAAAEGREAGLAAALGRARASAHARLHSYAAATLLSGPGGPSQPGDAWAAAWRLAEPPRHGLALPALQRHCEVARRDMDAGRQWQCSEAASALLAHASELAVRSLAIDLGRSAGWPEQQLAPLVAEQEALESMAGLPARALNPDDCASARQLRAWVQALETDGEVAHLRQMMAALGHPPALWRARRMTDWALAVATAAAARESIDAADAVPPR